MAITFSPVFDVLTGETMGYNLSSGLYISRDNPIYHTLTFDAVEDAAPQVRLHEGVQYPLLTGVQTPSYPNQKIAKILGCIRGWEAGIDAIRLSLSAKSPYIEEWKEAAQNLKDRYTLNNRVIPFKTKNGWEGERIGPLQLSILYSKGGDQPLRYAVECEGNPDGLTHEITRIFAPMATHCSRMDLQVTIVTDYHENGRLPLLLQFDRERRDKKGEVLTKNGCPPRYRLRREDGIDGDTFALGSWEKKSRLKARIYNKQIKGGIKDGYRYEIQLGVKYAQSMFEQLVLFYCEYGEVIPDRKYLAGAVLGYYQSKYVPIPDIEAVQMLSLKYQTPMTTVERLLIWFARQVAPSVRTLLDMGVPLRKILEALALDEVRTDLGEQTPIKMPPIDEVWSLAQGRAGYGRQLYRELSEKARAKIWFELDRLLRVHYKVVIPLPEYPVSDYWKAHFAELEAVANGA